MNGARGLCCSSLIILAFLAGCGSHHPLDEATTRPLVAVSNISTPSPRDAPQTPQLVFHVQMFLLSLPQGSYSSNEEFWKRIDETCVDPATSDLLYKNGIRLGVASLSELDHFNKFIQDIAPQQKFSVAGAEIKDVQLAMKSNLPEQTLFYFDKTNTLIGGTFPASENFLNVSCEPALRKPGQLRMTICPEIRSTQTRLQYTDRNGEIELKYINPEVIYELNCKVDIPQGSFLIITPSPDATKRTSIGNAFFMKDGAAEKLEQILLIVPMPFRIDPAKKPQ